MTFAIGHSGTHAGWKKPMGNATPWTCQCTITLGTRLHHGQTLDKGDSTWEVLEPFSNIAHRRQPAYLVRCTDCGAKRP